MKILKLNKNKKNMRFIYSYNSFNGKKLPTPFEKRMALLSVVSLRNARPNDTIAFYGDFAAATFFSDNGIRFDETNIVNFQFNNPTFWNTGKIEIYQRQGKKFLHVDFDTAFFPGFTIPEADIVTEKLRDYNCDDDLRRFGFANLPDPKKLICSGLIGGVNTFVFDDLYKNMYCNRQRIEAAKTAEFNELVSLEEYALTQLAEKQNLTVAEIPQTFFAHWQGENKEQRFGKVINDLCNMYGI